MFKKRVVVGLSGGVDSAVAAFLLKEQGYTITGVMGIFSDVEEFQLNRVRLVCEQLEIDLIEREMIETFSREVVDYFVSEYKKGRTPNPCIVCNRRIKFPLLESVREELSYDFIATGHYAKTSDEIYPLMRGKGADQAYFLSRVDKDILLKTILPLENLEKKQVVEKSKKIFTDIEWLSSRDICFVSKDYAGLVKSRYPDTGKSGPIEDTFGVLIGTHKGVAHYTVGQRRGLDTSMSVPLYVKSIIPEENLLVVGTRDECLTSSLSATHPIWLLPPEDGKVYKVQTYSTQTPFEAKLTLKENQFHLDFSRPEFQITPGQLTVIYENDAIIGSGWIE